MVLHAFHLSRRSSAGGVAFEVETFGRGRERLMGDEAVYLGKEGRT
ncbi:hypothetical protein MTR67_017494 [Solanum verrucosum]|uniref:Uncharacterized protein n=1 Tax=Solanum verrucosum TaxID=315347 RepID=A0AAF0QQE1_SOLVR|nr:hypothetical protein MTR67_017494 [Solanum verrucosum]